MKRALIVDAGNTTVSWRRWELDEPAGPVKRGRRDAAEDVVLAAMEGRAEAIVLIVSAPELGVVIEAEATLAGMKVLRPGRDLPVPMETEYRDPGQLGVDRLLQAYAAMKQFGAPVVTCSAGTCVTMEAVDKRGVLVGGAIAPGLRAMMAGIKAAAPHLPMPEELPLAGLGGDVVGKTTEENLSVGIWLSLGAMIDRMAELGRYAVGKGTPVVMTGGDAKAAVRYCREVTRIVPDLAMEGATRALEGWVEDEQS